MPRRVLVIVIGLFVVVSGGWVVWNSRWLHAPASNVATAPAPPVAAPRGAPAPPPATETVPERTPAAAPRAARRPPPPKDAEPAPEPAAAAVTGTLHVSSDVTGAQVFIDRNYIGVTPVTSPELAPGSHRINIVAQGYESIAENVDVETGSRDLRFNFKEIKLDASIDVVHKHRLGSCKGRSTATPQGLRYDRDDK